MKSELVKHITCLLFDSKKTFFYFKQLVNFEWLRWSYHLHSVFFPITHRMEWIFFCIHLCLYCNTIRVVLLGAVLIFLKFIVYSINSLLLCLSAVLCCHVIIDYYTLFWHVMTFFLWLKNYFGSQWDFDWHVHKMDVRNFDAFEGRFADGDECEISMSIFCSEVWWCIFSSINS